MTGAEAADPLLNNYTSLNIYQISSHEGGSSGYASICLIPALYVSVCILLVHVCIVRICALMLIFVAGSAVTI